MLTQYFGVFVVQTGHTSIRRTKECRPLGTLDKLDIPTLKRLWRISDGVYSYLILPQDFKHVAPIHHALG